MTEMKQLRDTRTASLVAALISHGLVDPAREREATDVVDTSLGGQQGLPSSLRQRFAELAGYVGGAFVVSAAVIFFSDQWGSLSDAQQVGTLAGAAVTLAVAGLVLAVIAGGFAALRAGRQPVVRRLAGVLFTGAAASAAFAVALQIEAANPSGDDSGFGLAASITMFVVAALGYGLAPTVVGQLGVAAGALSAIPFGLDFFFKSSNGEIAIGLLILGLGAVWLVLAETGVWGEVAAARVIGCAMAVLGAQLPTFGGDSAWVGYLATALVAAIGFAAYVAKTAWPYLATGVIGVTLVVPEALLDWTDGTLGSAGALLVTGVTLLVACLLGLRLRHEVTDEAHPA